jgi:hypothetical protein
MSIKIALLKSGETVISDIKELISDEKVCGYLFNNPHKVEYNRPIFLSEESNKNPTGELQVSLSPWIVLTSDTQIPVRPDWIVTIVEPIKSIQEMYEGKLNAEEYTVPFTED